MLLLAVMGSRCILCKASRLELKSMRGVEPMLSVGRNWANQRVGLGAPYLKVMKETTRRSELDLTVIEAKTLPEAWFLCVKKCMEEGYEYTIDKGSFAGQKRKEFDLVSVRVEYPGSRPLVPDTPQGVPPPTTMDYVEGYLPYLMTGVKQEGEFYTYGEDIDIQLPEVIKRYKEGGYETNQLCITIGSSRSMFLEHSQCLRLIDTRVRYGKLHFVVYFRSWDLWAGFPANLAAIQILKEYLASEIGVEDGELFAFSKGLHLYDYSWELANLATGRVCCTECGRTLPFHNPKCSQNEKMY